MKEKLISKWVDKDDHAFTAEIVTTKILKDVYGYTAVMSHDGIYTLENLEELEAYLRVKGYEKIE